MHNIQEFDTAPVGRVLLFQKGDKIVDVISLQSELKDYYLNYDNYFMFIKQESYILYN